MDVAILHEEFVEGSALGHQVMMMMTMMRMMTIMMMMTVMAMMATMTMMMRRKVRLLLQLVCLQSSKKHS